MAQREGQRLERGIGLFQATATNMSQMMGAGPFITIPIILQEMGGPQAVFGWMTGAILAALDGLVWSELGSAMPGEGGTYVYLREAFQYRSGKLMPFLFIWSTIIVTPLIMSTGAIGLTQYLGYFFPHMTGLESKLVAVFITIMTIALLWRRIHSVAKLTTVLWIGVILTVVMVIIAASTHFNAHVAFSFPPNAFAPSKFLLGLGSGMLLSIYDYLGYYTASYLGDEVSNPGKTIPRAILMAILFVAMIDLSMNIGIIGNIPWQTAMKSTDIGTQLVQSVWGRPGAIIITVLIIWTCFASVYAGLLGASRLPYNAARDGLFFKSFAKLHPKLNFPHVSLLVMGVIMAICCFFNLTTIINALMAMAIVIQFMGQIVALTVLRKRQPNLKRPFRQWLYPIPSILAFIGWAYVFYSSGWSAIRLAMIWTALGIIAFLIWAYRKKEWPFGKKVIQEVYATPSAESGE
ncbi:APC family permease [Alicyclobacillus acidoterrestris]|uniref:Amino acid permease n=1 Tax=Alicyclobacillus acidoterrestris (strain ATCC 49025 / DSM 3922 / CIP 106132 / NCIMB 13137 / GD3B) TaxID=1356854 RepID=T0CRN7_ALIAG|nr:amino acid permease [Alicyclobacillus acidoterrestris]EPZ42132.1 amino acid permease [Alicyclobacillus acidoterrestris ATCC 49025]UNO48695.1 amino acid permease [Alicyclobacillus acidoterrestris]